MNHKIVVFACGLTLLSACGGGGGGAQTGTEQPVTIAFDASRGGTKGTDVEIVGLSVGESIFQLVEFGTRVVDELDPTISSDQAISCDNDGSATVTFDDADADRAVSVGDSLIASFTKCERAELQDQANGVLSISVGEGHLDRGASNTELQMTLDFAAFQVATGSGEEIVIDGSIDYQRVEEVARSATEGLVGIDGLRFDLGFSIEEASNFVFSRSTDYINDQYTFAFSGRISSGALGGYFDAATEVPFAGGTDNEPYRGLLMLYGGAETAVRIEAREGKILFSGEYDGDGLFDDETVSQHWGRYVEGALFEAQRGLLNANEADETAPLETATLSSAGHDLIVDRARAIAYVSLPETDRVVSIDLNSMSVLREDVVGSQPRGMELSVDGSELYVALSGAGSVAIMDLENHSVRAIDVSEQLNGLAAWDVIEPVAGKVLVSADSVPGPTYIALIERGLLVRKRRVADGHLVLADTGFAESFDGNAVYLAQRIASNALYKLDATQDGMPIVLEGHRGSVSETKFLEISPDGRRVYTHSGLVLDAASFEEIGEIEEGPMAISSDGGSISVETAPGTIHRYETQYFGGLGSFRHSCDQGQIKAFKRGLVDGTFYILRDDLLCRVTQ